MLNQRALCRSMLLAAPVFAMAIAAPRAARADVPPDPRRPNVLLVLIDDLGPEWIGCYGAEDVETPHIDRLAGEGMLFECAYSMPQCTPTRVTLLTGQYPFRHGWTNHWDVPRWGAGCHFDPERYVTFAEVLRSAGYATAAAGKWQINDFRVQPDAMRQHGFDESCMWTGFETGNPPSAERYWDPYVHTHEGSTKRVGRFGPDVFVDFLIDFMRRHHAQPMLLYYPMVLTHLPLTSTPLEPDVDGRQATHRAMVRYVDHCVGRLVAALEELDLRRRTIVIVTGDNGTAGGITAHANGRSVRGGKASLRETGVRTPLVVSCPGRVPQGVRTDALVDATDFLPTLAELCGACLPEGSVLDGHSLADVLLGRSEVSNREWIMAMGFGPARLTSRGVEPVQRFTDRVIRDKRYKLWVVSGRSALLFDLARDPDEATNLIDSSDPGVSAARRRLEAVWRGFPERDAAPQYTPTPRQTWDRKPDA